MTTGLSSGMKNGKCSDTREAEGSDQRERSLEGMTFGRVNMTESLSAVVKDALPPEAWILPSASSPAAGFLAPHQLCMGTTLPTEDTARRASACAKSWSLETSAGKACQLVCALSSRPSISTRPFILRTCETDHLRLLDAVSY